MPSRTAVQSLASPTSWAGSVRAALARQAHSAVHQVFSQTGLASWYDHRFAGRRTSSGARFDPKALTCAHRTLPLGTRLLVTSSDTGRSVVVTVNDRGPYAGADRIIDLSRAAASRLGIVRDGVDAVTVSGVGPGLGSGDLEVAQAADGDNSAQALAAVAATR